MPILIPAPTRITAAGNKPKLIDEYVGRVNTKQAELSVAHMRSPGGWLEPGQTPEFRELTVVIKGALRVEHKGGHLERSAPREAHVQRAGAVNCSDLGRALEMARRLAARTGHPVPQDPRLRERGLAVLNASWSQFDDHAGAFRLVTWGT